MVFPSDNNMKVVRYYVLIGIAVILFGILLFRIYDLQIRRYSDLSSEAVDNMYRKYNIPAPRGILYDRKGRPLVFNKNNYDLEVYPFEIRSDSLTWACLSDILEISAGELKERMQKNMIGYYRPAKIATDLKYRTVSLINEHRLELNGVVLTSRPTRQYIEGNPAGHLFGYTSEINRQNIRRYSAEGYRSGDYIGVKGLEKQYEKELRGVNGTRYMRVNAVGKDFGEDFSKTIQPVAGNDVYLSIDWELQNFIESFSDTLPYAAIVVNYRNGEIHAMTSQPDYDPELFSGTLSSEDWQMLLNDPRRPLINRTVQSAYPPGSIFKPVAALAAIDKNIISPNKTYFCSGVYQLGRRSYRCWKPEGHGSQNMYEALEHSCNIYFYHLIQDIGLQIWNDYAAMFLFGKITGIDIPDEKAGLLPDARYLDRRYGRNGWTRGLLLNFVIGQGDVLVTPVQVARYVCALASRGRIVTPHLARAVYDRRTELLRPLIFPVDSIRISPRAWTVADEGMRLVMQGETGTARYSNVSGLDMRGKTGTAQNPHGEAHGWFIGYSTNPEFPYAVVTFVENGKSGSGAAAPLAKKILKFYYQRMKD